MLAGVGLLLPSVAESQSQPLVTAEQVPHLALGDQLQDSLASSRRIEVELILKQQNLSELDSLAADIADPDSSLYRHYLSPAQFASMFDPSDATVAAVDAQLESIGLTPGPARDDNRFIPINTDVAAVETAFHTGLRQVRVTGRNDPGYTFTTAAMLPSGLASSVESVVGLSDLAQVETPSPGQLESLQALNRNAQSGPVSQDALATQATTSGPSDCAGADALASEIAADGYSYPNTYSVLDDYYGMDPMYTSGFDGSGETVALLELGSDFNTSDVDTFQACYGSTSTVTREPPIDGGPGATPEYEETELDIDSVLGAAPQANIDVYEGGPSSTVSQLQAWIDTLAAIVTSPSPAPIVSISLGLCEPAWEAEYPSYLTATDTLLEEAAMQGQTVLVAAGDSGSEACEPSVNTDTGLAVNYPASDPWVTSVGGTENAAYALTYLDLPPAPGASEGAWNEGCEDVDESLVCGGGGGGFSTVFPRPSWQAGPGVDNSAYPNEGREVPDVSAEGDPYTGYVVYDSTCGSSGCNDVGDDGWMWIGGTSGAAPFWAGAVALMDEKCTASNDGPVGFADPALYTALQQDPNDFNDIPADPVVDGNTLPSNNDTTGTNGGAYPTTAGYDMATGIGSPNVSLLSDDLCSPATLGIVVGQSGSFVSGSTGTYTLTVTDPGSPTSGQLTVTDDLPAGVTFSSGSGDGFSCSAAGQTVTCTSTTSISSAAPAVIDLQVDVSAAAGTVLSNQASVSPHGGSSNVDQVTVSSTATQTTTASSSTPSSTTATTGSASTTAPLATETAASSSGASSSGSLAFTGTPERMNWILLLGALLFLLGATVRLSLRGSVRRSTPLRQ